MKLIRIALILAASLPFTDQVLGDQLTDLITSAKNRANHFVVYDGSYYSIPYPGGDIPENRGVCTDVVIRSYRGIGVDLQKLVHEDIKQNFDQYPSKRIWGLTGPDRNIDHRRVPNLRKFFERKGDSLPVTERSTDYKPGDIVSWMLPGNRPHIGIVTDKTDPETGNPLIIHNIGLGPRIEDMMFDYSITGHYRYLPD